MDNTFKFIPLNAESSSCEVTPPPHGIPKKIKRKIPQANISEKPAVKRSKKISLQAPIVKKAAANNTGSGELIAGGMIALGTGLSLIPHFAPQVGGRLLMSGGAALLSGCIDMSAKPKQQPLPPYPDYYPPFNDGGKPSPKPSSSPDNIKPSPDPSETTSPSNPSPTPSQAIPPLAPGTADNSLEFDPAKLEVSNINSSTLVQIKNETVSMNTAYGASVFFNKYKSFLDHLIKEKSLMEGFQKALQLTASSSTYGLEISKALVNYYLKYNFLIEEPSSNTLDWQIFSSAFDNLKNQNSDDAENVFNNFIKFGVNNAYSSLHMLEKILEKYVSLLQSKGKAGNLIQKIKNEYPAEIIIEAAPLSGTDLAKSNVITLLASILTLPGNYYSELKKTTLSGSASGQYIDKHVIVNSNRPFNTIHEIGHHWSDIIADAQLIVSYFKISWDDTGHTLSDKSIDFAEEYGAESNAEDFATALNGYVRDASNLRSKIRNQLSTGKFELAAKYLFIKYFTPFKGKEFYTDINPPLRAKEVSDAIARTGKDASPQVMAIVNSIVSSGK